MGKKERMDLLLDRAPSAKMTMGELAFCKTWAIVFVCLVCVAFVPRKAWSSAEGRDWRSRASVLASLLDVSSSLYGNIKFGE